MAISRVLDIAGKGLSVYQSALSVTANNVANSSNEDYSRQKVVLSATASQKIAGLTWGSGVTISEITRVHDNLLEKQILTYNQSNSYQETKSELLSEIENVISEPTDSGLATLMDEFFSSWTELSVSPQSSTLRNQVVTTAQSISTRVSELYSDLDSVSSDCVSNFKADVDTINNLLDTIKTYNNQISSATVAGETPNDLLDLRDAAISDLSEIVNISVAYSDSNVAQITIGGVFACDANYSVDFTTSLKDGELSLVSTDSQKTAVLKGGDIYAYADVYNNVVPSYIEEIDTLMNTLVEAVNSIHSTGYTNTDPQMTDIDFFESYSDGNLVINQSIVDDPNNIAISSDGTEGNGDIAVSIAELADKELIDGSTLSETYGSFITKIGTDITTSDSLLESSGQILEQLTTEKASYSGVSTDEEMTNLIIYQRAYQACSKLISIEDEMLDTLINMV